MIEECDVRDKYNKLQNIWDISDQWHYHTYRKIKQYLYDYLSIEDGVKLSERVLLAGSGGNSYGISGDFIYHLDIAENLLNFEDKSIVGSVTNIPFFDESFDIVICVGSVLNYVDAQLAIKELNRVTKKGGALVLEYETSNSYEFIFTDKYKESATPIHTFYNGESEHLWLYSIDYINSILHSFNLLEKKSNSIHIISTLLLRSTGNPKLSSKLSKLDPFFQRVNIIKRGGCNFMAFLLKCR